jgi:hypothetical protein
MDGLSFHCHATMYQAVIDFHSNEFCCLRTPIGLKLVSADQERSTWVDTVDSGDSRSSVLVNGSLVMDYTLRCCPAVQVDR